MNDPILAKINRWAASYEDSDLDDVVNQIEFLEEKLFYDYEPTKGPHPAFWQRLIDWLDNVEERQTRRFYYGLFPIFSLLDGKNSIHYIGRLIMALLQNG